MEANVHANAHANTREVQNSPAFRTKHPGPLTFEKILLTLAILTVFEVIISTIYTDFHVDIILIAIILVFFSLVKATLVGGFFMHIFYEKKPFTIFMIAFGFPMLIVLPMAIIIITL